MRSIILTAFLVTAPVPGGDAPQGAPSKPLLPDLREELLQMARADQDARSRLLGSPSPDPSAEKEILEIDRKNTDRLKEIVRRHGWPGKTLAGADGASAAWLLVQHADRDREFQKKCLALLEAAVQAGEASAKDLAFLTDRVLLAEGKKQRYGTQFLRKDGEMVPQPIEDAANVDRRRAAIGLSPLEEYGKSMRETYSPVKVGGDPLEDLPLLRDFEMRRITSADPTGGNNDWRVLEPGRTLVLADIQGPGCIVHFRDNITGREPHHLQLHVLRMYWDSEATPSVEAPAGDFFGVGFGFTEKFSSALICIDQRPGKLTDPSASGAARNCYIPMPFARSARIEISNEGKAQSLHWFEVNYKAYRRPPENVGRFHAQYRQGTPPPEGPYLILEARGRGHLAGCVLSVKNVDGGWWGEGDEIVSIDGKHAIQGTGSEDYFCESYGLRPGCFPYFGVTLCEEPFTTAYRWHVLDPVPFRESLRFLIEHGQGVPPFRSRNCYYSVAYWYQEEPHAPFPELPGTKARLSWILPGSIRDWWVIGPFDNAGKKGFDAAYPPESEIDLAKSYPGAGGAARWKKASAGADGGLDLVPLFQPSEDVAAYALAYIRSPLRQEALLLAGSDDTLTAWLNGKKVIARNEYRLAAPDQDSAEVTLEQGWNALLLKICQGPLHWKLYCRVLDPKREEIPGLRFSLVKE